jgi:hypothetical protein
MKVNADRGGAQDSALRLSERARDAIDALGVFVALIFRDSFGAFVLGSLSSLSMSPSGKKYLNPRVCPLSIPVLWLALFVSDG